MTDYAKLIDKLRKLEAVFTGTNFDGERTAASVAIEKIGEKLKSVEIVAPPIQYKFTIGDMWCRKLFVALRRSGLKPYRYPKQRHTTVMVNVSPEFVDETLWPEFLELGNVLEEYPAEITDKVIADSIFADTFEAETRSQPARLRGNSQEPGNEKSRAMDHFVSAGFDCYFDSDRIAGARSIAQRKPGTSRIF